MPGRRRGKGPSPNPQKTSCASSSPGRGRTQCGRPRLGPRADRASRVLGSGHSVGWDDGTSSLLLVEIGVRSGGRTVALFDRLGGGVAVGTAATLALHAPRPGRLGGAGGGDNASRGRTLFSLLTR